MIFAAIVASPRPRTGKTLLARLLAENFILAGTRPLIFDTDGLEQTLSASFPREAISLDLDHVPDQMALFEALTSPSPQSRVVDLTPRAFAKFFTLMRDSDFLNEAYARKIIPAIFYIPGPDPDSIARGFLLREQVGAPAFVVVDNFARDDARASIRMDDSFRPLRDHPNKIVMPALDRGLIPLLEDRSLSFSEFIRKPRGELAFAGGDAMRSWLLKNFQEIHHALQKLQSDYFSALSQNVEENLRN